VDPMTIALAATRFAERVTDRFKEVDREALKRLLDTASEELEAALSRPAAAHDPADRRNRAVAEAELALVQRVFASL